MNFSVRFFAWIAILGWIASADMVKAQQENFLKAELTTLSWSGKTPVLWYESGSGIENLQAYERGFTTPKAYIGPRTIRFYQEENALALPFDQRPEPAAAVTLPPQGGQFLLVFTKKPDSELQWEIQVFDNSLQNLPAGAYRVVNLTKSSYLAVFDQTTLPIQPSGITVIRPPKQDETRDMAVRFVHEKKVIYSSIWGHQENRRGTIFLLPKAPDSHRITIRRFFQPVVPEATTKEP